MYKLEVFDKKITEQLKIEDQEKKALHIPSGKLSASGLSDPLQWQVLKTLGVGVRVVDDYVFRKFARGRDVEDWYLAMLEKSGTVFTRQEAVEYRGVVGYIDASILTPLTAKKSLVIPHEVKSVTNAKFKQIEKRLGADEGHMLQAGLYALGKGCSHYAITYIASDDYRTLTWVFSLKDVQGKIDAIIDAYDSQMAKQVVPVFSARYAWQEKAEYNKFPEWQHLNAKEIKLALDYYYPGAWENYKKNV